MSRLSIQGVLVADDHVASRYHVRNHITESLRRLGFGDWSVACWEVSPRSDAPHGREADCYRFACLC